MCATCSRAMGARKSLKRHTKKLRISRHLTKGAFLTSTPRNCRSVCLETLRSDSPCHATPLPLQLARCLLSVAKEGKREAKMKLDKTQVGPAGFEPATNRL